MMERNSLKDKTVKGTVWSGIDNVVQFSVIFVVSVVLARLLSPDDYGLIGIVTIFTTICATFVDGGFSNALIRKKEATKEDYNTVFIVNLSASLVLYVVIFLCAPFIARFFNRWELTDLIRVSSLALIAGAFSMVQKTQMIRRIDFKTQAKITLIASVASGVIGIIMAYCGYGVWALVAQTMISQFLRTFLLCFYNRWMPNLCFSSNSFHELFNFGWKMAVANLLNTIWNDLYQVVVGKFYSPATLGQYTRAKNFSTLFSSNLTMVIQRVTYPVLAGIQDDKKRMVSAYRRVIKITMFVTAIPMFILGAVSEPFIYCLIGPKWNEASIYLPLICISGSLYPLHAINLNMLQVQGRSDLYLGLEIVKKTIGIFPLIICYFYGIMPMLYVNVAVGIICYFLNSHFSGKFIGYSSWMQIKDISSSYLIAIMISIIVFPMKYIPLVQPLILMFQIVIGFLLFFTICRMFKVGEYQELKYIVLEYINRK